MYTNNLFTANNIATTSQILSQMPCQSNTPSLCATDKILVSVYRLGQEIETMQLCGFQSVEQILHTLAQRYSRVEGLLSIRLRNPRLGWTCKRTIRAARMQCSLLATA